MIKLIVGLGNPGKKYTKTRHNAGFNVLDLLESRWGTGWKNWKDRAEVSVKNEGGKITLAKPMLLMNNSGQAVRGLLDYYGILPDDMLVVSDDFSLELGQLRLRQKGSSGGHNGLESIIMETGTSSFARLRLGIGKVPAHVNPADFVLSEFSLEESKVMKETCEKAVEVIEDVLSSGLESAVSRMPASTMPAGLPAEQTDEAQESPPSKKKSNK